MLRCIRNETTRVSVYLYIHVSVCPSKLIWSNLCNKRPFLWSSQLSTPSPVCRVWQNSTRSRGCRANFSCVHRVQYDLLYQNMCACRYRDAISIRRVRVLGTFPAVLDDLNIKFSRGRMPLDLPSMFMLHRSVHSKEGLQRRLQTNCQSVHSYITSPF